MNRDEKEIIKIISEKRKSFILYNDQFPTIESLTDEEAGILFKSIFKYVKGEDIDTTFGGTRTIEIAFKPIQSTLIRDALKYKHTCQKNKANIKKRWKDNADTIV